eukprot:495111-Rhodomonas_salina.1
MQRPVLARCACRLRVAGAGHAPSSSLKPAVNALSVMKRCSFSFVQRSARVVGQDQQSGARSFTSFRGVSSFHPSIGNEARKVCFIQRVDGLVGRRRFLSSGHGTGSDQNDPARERSPADAYRPE